MTSRATPLWLVLPLALAVAALWLVRRDAATPDSPPAPEPPALSDLAPMPDWSRFDRFQGTVYRADFLREMDEIFTVSPAWREWFEVGEEEVKIRTSDDPAEDIRLRFAAEGRAHPVPRFWRPLAELPPAPPEAPLEGLKVAIDPGHIGGRWGTMEERWLKLPGTAPIQEGDMTLAVAKLLKPRLEALGANVSLVRVENEPVTRLRPESLHREAGKSSAGGDIARLAERLFYRTAEIRARAWRVNQTIKPDLVLCLHFNADAWGNPAAPVLVPGNHFHMILNGGYTDAEIALADQRHDLLLKLLQGVHAEEARLSASVAAAFVEITAMPPYRYDPAARNARNVDGNPYLWARNLLANRLYHCPVIYFEPYVMNSVVDHARMRAGDYEGSREVAGKSRPSIFREYADAAALGLRRYYQTRATAR